MRFAFIIAAVLLVILAVTNPTEAEFREHVRQETGIAGQFGLVLTDMVSGGVQRENYLFASRFYLGGDGILPRQNIAWGIAGQFIEIDEGGPSKTLPRR